jgi:hypothetical protein
MSLEFCFDEAADFSLPALGILDVSKRHI